MNSALDVALTLLFLICLGVAVWRTVGHFRDERAAWADLPVLDDLDTAHQRHGSRIWRLAPPCGYPTWDLYAPGTAVDEHGFILGRPYATFDAVDGPGRQRADDPCTRLDERMRAWLLPWVEEITGAPVLDVTEGLGGLYGDGMREWTVFILVGDPARTDA